MGLEWAPGPEETDSGCWGEAATKEELDNNFLNMVYCLSDILLEFLIPDFQMDKPKTISTAASVGGVLERAGPSAHGLKD
ncbi:hypothetical protein lerEdw1_004456 [Lerista edwardsae]|nr:hypothetical protein lerEdw1_004456 [Lerista edwardsae]